MQKSEPTPFPSHHSTFRLHLSLTLGQKAVVQVKGIWGEVQIVRGLSALWLFFFDHTIRHVGSCLPPGIKPVPPVLDCQGSPSLVSFMGYSGRQ